MTAREMPFIQLSLGGEPFIGTPENLELFTFSEFAVLWNGARVLNPIGRNHVFAQFRENEEVRTGAYILLPETVQQLGAVMLHHNFPARLNQMTIPESDENAYLRYIDQQVEHEDVDDFFPGDWSA